MMVFSVPGPAPFIRSAISCCGGYSIDKAQIHSNFINLASNIASILFFIFGGKMIWSLGLVMFAGQSLGARLGATVVLTRGKKVIRPMIVIVSICISVKMLLDMY
ncbi:TSUP family transporter [Citrobacter freundii]|nr:TSUP family transporter [Citrobacter freundii]